MKDTFIWGLGTDDRKGSPPEKYWLSILDGLWTSLSSRKDMTDHLSITLLRSSLGTCLSQSPCSTQIDRWWHVPSWTTLTSFSFSLFYSEVLFALSFTSLHLFIIHSTSPSPYFLPLSMPFNLYTILTCISQVYQSTQGLAAVHIPHKKR